MSVYSWLNFLGMETVESIRGLSTYDMPDADRTGLTFGNNLVNGFIS